MDWNKRNVLGQRPSVQFKRKGSSNKRGSWNSSNQEQSSGNAQSLETVYRILCPSKKIGGVIGKGGGIIKSLREETRSKITVADSVPGSDERVIIIFSPPNKIPRKQNNDEDLDKGDGQEPLELHCAAQDALLKVHDRIVEEDHDDGVTFDDDNENIVVTRLLVPNNLVGCLLGKHGSVIQRLRNETHANIRVLPADQLPTCAMETDELVQISGKPGVAKRALYEVSTLLHQNPRKDTPPLNLTVPFGGQGFHLPGAPNFLPPGNQMWPNREPAHSIPPMPCIGEYESSEYARGGFIGGPEWHGVEAPAEFFIKILCSAGKIGGVIGKGGFNVKQLQEETGASIHVQDASTNSEERVIRVSAFEALRNPRSQTIEAILQLQNKASESSDKGTITTKLLVPSSKVGCILGQGGQVINEMRRRTQADIRVYSKDDRPKCAAEDEELVQISGNFVVAKDALAEITSRLRVRTLRDTNAGEEHAHVGPPPRFGPPGSLPVRGMPPPPRAIRASSSGQYDHLKVGGYEYEPERYPVPPAASGYQRVNRALDGRIPNSAVDSFTGIEGSNVSHLREVSQARVRFQDSHSTLPERVSEIRGPGQLNAAQNILQALTASVGQNASAQPSSNHNANTLQGSYSNISDHQSPYHINAPRSPYRMNDPHSPYRGNIQQSPYQIKPQQSPYQTNAQKSPYRINSHQGPYQFSAQQSSYQLSAPQGPNPNIKAPQGAHNNFSSQQGAYHNLNSQQGAYRNLNSQQGAYNNQYDLNPQQGAYKYRP
ncbi:KH domain-containing protein At4g18375-like [Argentina anserina]|uniref:KH domain-containing protein At4g18375-like n=1 Tax=Argentina anserina TaxID=57926 RepID=UPI00217679C7|nr:KH domain-containing protein At4g18375-like [Potentilla anserina]XP_050382436.1 KH domain-containing protein At4g18375-like [Potentilla anserina]XP_050382438.1 KH domain-containing protein At4g18375-like [Potentilla anserina]XP_050382439.1 KH domain-containing protein At4g18375-like [Potentilla anserina]